MSQSIPAERPLPLSARRCLLCGGESAEEAFTSDDYLTWETFSVVRCLQCGLAWTHPMPSPQELGRYYPDAYYVAGTGDRRAEIEAAGPEPPASPAGESSGPPPAAPRAGGLRGLVGSLLFRLRRAQVDRVLAALARRRGVAPERLEPGRVLDVGCGKGWLLHEFRQRGWEVAGTELSPRSAGFAQRELRLPVHCGDLHSHRFPDAHFDLVTLWHVLEHLRDPVAAVREVSRILKPGGVFAAAVPNQGGYLARLGRGRWFHLDVPRHLYHFRPETLRRLVSEAGLQPLETRHLSLEYDVGDALQTPLNLLLPRPNLLYHLLRTRRVHTMGGSPWGAYLETGISLVLAPLLLALSVPWAYVAASRGAGSTVEVYAGK